MDHTQAWQSVLEQLRMEMPKASFDTWVRDTTALSLIDGVLTVDARNAYACGWLESHLASTVTRLLVGILNANVAVNFVAAQEVEAVDVGDTEMGEGEVREDPEKLVEISAEEYDSIYEQVVRPDRAVRLPGYFRRWLRLLGPDLGWFYVSFRQSAYMAGARGGSKASRFTGKNLAALAGITERTYWNRMSNGTTWEKLKGLVNISDHGPEWDESSSTPKRLPRRYSVAMTLPLTPVDACSLRVWLSSHIEEFGGPEGALRAAAEAPLENLIPLEATAIGDPVTVRNLVHEFAEGELSNELLDSLASAIQNHIMPTHDLIVVTLYFLKHVLPHIGAGPGWMLTLLRDMCYVNPKTGETRNRVTVEGGYDEIARWLGMSRPLTIYEWLHGKKKDFFREPVLRVYAREVAKEKQLDFETQPRVFDVLIEDAPRQIIEAALTNTDLHAIFSIESRAVYATFSIGFTPLAEDNYATFSIAFTQFAYSVYATCTVKALKLFKPSSLNSFNLNPINPSPCEDNEIPENRAGGGDEIPSAWNLETLLTQNHAHRKTKAAVLEAKGETLVSWMLYAIATKADKPWNLALFRLAENPTTGAGGKFDTLAALPPAELVEMARSRINPFGNYKHANDLWTKALGRKTTRDDAETLLRLLLGEVEAQQEDKTDYDALRKRMEIELAPFMGDSKRSKS